MPVLPGIFYNPPQLRVPCCWEASARGLGLGGGLEKMLLEPPGNAVSMLQDTGGMVG